MKSFGLIDLPRGVEYNREEDVYFIRSFRYPNKKYEVFKLNKIWVCSCKGFQFNKNRITEGCKHTKRIKIIDQFIIK